MHVDRFIMFIFIAHSVALFLLQNDVWTGAFVVQSKNKVLLQYFASAAGKNVKIRIIDDIKLIVHGIHDILYKNM